MGKVAQVKRKVTDPAMLQSLLDAPDGEYLGLGKYGIRYLLEKKDGRWFNADETGNMLRIKIHEFMECLTGVVPRDAKIAVLPAGSEEDRFVDIGISPSTRAKIHDPHRKPRLKLDGGVGVIGPCDLTFLPKACQTWYNGKRCPRYQDCIDVYGPTLKEAEL